jgi:hypothetical protein
MLDLVKRKSREGCRECNPTKGSSLYILDVQRERNSTKFICVLINVVEKKGDSCMWHQNLNT